MLASALLKDLTGINCVVGGAMLTPSAFKDIVGTALLLVAAIYVSEVAGGFKALLDVLWDDIVPPPILVAPPLVAYLDGLVGLLYAIVISVDDDVPFAVEVLELAL